MPVPLGCPIQVSPDLALPVDRGRARGAYPALQNSAYFNYGAVGPLSKHALAAISRAYELLESFGPYSVEANLWIEEEAAQTRTLLETALNAPAGSIALVESICAACNVVLWGIDWRPGDHIVISGSENVGVAAIVQTVAERFSLTVTRVSVTRALVEDPVREIERVLRPETRLVVLSHILQPTGEPMPIAGVVELCRSQPAASRPMLLVDGAQAVGAAPVSLHSLDPDFYAFTGSKWWCGPGGLAGLYIRPGLLDVLRPSFAGWRGLAHDRTGKARLHPDARRFEMATSAYPLLAGLRAAVGLHAQAAGADARRKAMLDTARYFQGGLRSFPARAGVQIVPDTPGRESASAIVSFAIRATRPVELVRFLEARQILIREIDDPPCTRVCIHYLTTPEETNQLLEAIGDFVARKTTVTPRGSAIREK